MMVSGSGAASAASPSELLAKSASSLYRFQRL